MSIFLKILLTVLGAAVVFCLVVLVTASIKNVTFVELLKEWFTTAPEAESALRAFVG